MNIKAIIGILLGATLLFGCLGGSAKPEATATPAASATIAPTATPVASATVNADLPPLPPEQVSADQAQQDLDQTGDLLNDIPPIPSDIIQ